MTLLSGQYFLITDDLRRCLKQISDSGGRRGLCLRAIWLGRTGVLRRLVHCRIVLHEQPHDVLDAGFGHFPQVGPVVGAAIEIARDDLIGRKIRDIVVLRIKLTRDGS